MKTTSATEGLCMEDRKKNIYIYIYRGESRLIYLRNDNKGPKVLSHLFFLHSNKYSFNVDKGCIPFFFTANVVP